MMSIDYDSEEKASKALIVIFIILTIINNGVLLIKYIRIPGFLHFPGICIRITIALGSIFLALFSYIVKAKFFYGHGDDLTCKTKITSLVYFLYFLPFVVGCSLVLQGLILYAGNTFMSKLNPKIKSFILASIPWILGLGIVCPLALAGTDWDDGCKQDFTNSRYKAIEAIAVVLPACVAILSIVVFSVNKKGFTTDHRVSSQTPAVITSQGQGGVATMYQNPTVSPPFPAQTPQQHPEQILPQYPQQNVEAHPQLYPPSNINPHMPASNPIVPMMVQDRNGPITLTPQDIAFEMQCLVKASLLFFFSVMPLACFTLGYILDKYRSDNLSFTAATIIDETCFWLYHLYPTLLPLFWRSQIKS